LSPQGYFVAGHSASYSFEILGSPIISVRRVHTAARVQPGEFEDWNERGGARGSPAGAGNISDARAARVKPAYDDIVIALDGRVWISVSTEAVMNGAAVAGGASPARYARERWPAPKVFDIFETDGRYVGRVRFPSELTTATDRAFHGEHVFATVLDANDEPVVQRFRIVW
jgi:hypothetical protein